MPHLKCEACRIRLHSPQSPIDEVGELCPVCGSLLEPVRRLSELMGLRLIRDDAWLADGDRALPEAVAQAMPNPDPPS